MGYALSALVCTAFANHDALTAQTDLTGVGHYMAKLIAGKMASHTFAALVQVQAERCVLMQPISESAFLQQIKALAYIHGWTFHHSTPSVTSKGRWITTGAPGFPDVVMAHRARGVIFAELKTDKGKTTAAQDDWLERLSPHVECYLWRPSDLSFITQRLSQC